MLYTYNKSLRLANDTVKFVSKKLGNIESANPDLKKFPAAPMSPEAQAAQLKHTAEKMQTLAVSKKLIGDLHQDSTSIIRNVQSLLGLKATGKYTTETKQAVMNFQASHGLLADGTIGRNTFAKLTGAPQVIMANAEAPIDIKTPSKKGFFSNLIESFSFKKADKVRYNTFKALKAIDPQIDATTSGLKDLEKSIFDIRDTANQQEISAVYNQALVELKGKLSPDMYQLMASAKNPLEEAYVLSYVSNALMGGKSSVNVVKNHESKKGYVDIIKSQGAKANAEFARLGFSSSIIDDIKDARRQNIAEINAGGKVNAIRIGTQGTELAFSLRTKGDTINGIQGFGAGATEALQIGKILGGFNISETADDISLLASKLTPVQLSEIAVRLGRKTITNEQVQGLIGSGKLKASIKYYMAENCGNDSLSLVLKYPKTVTPTQPESHDPQNPNSTPSQPTTGGGDDTGGDNSDGGTTGDGSNGSTGGTEGGNADV